MVSASIVHSEEQFQCSICLDLLIDPISIPCGHNYCKVCITYYWDTKDVCQCPLCNKTFDKRPDIFVNTFISEVVGQFKSHKLKEEYEKKTKAEIEQMIQDRQLKMHEVKQSMELNKKDADREIADSVQVFTALVGCIQRSQAELIDVIEAQLKTTDKQAEGSIKELQREITGLEKRNSELAQCSNTSDNLRNSTSVDAPPSIKDWTKVDVRPSSYVGTLRTAVAQLEKTLSQEMEKKLCDVDLIRRIQQYAVNVTLDPDTASPYLVLSEDRKQVSCGNVKKSLPDTPKRFSHSACVLGKESFSSGRFYYEVQVRGKTFWELGVARESINRKETIKLKPGNGYWAIWLRNGNEYKALTGYADAILPVREKIQTVGVFVDYEEGLVSFHDVEARVHLCSFTGCTFTEKLYPFFGPCSDHSGKNSAPLVITPVNDTMKDVEEGRQGEPSEGTRKSLWQKIRHRQIKHGSAAK